MLDKPVDAISEADLQQAIADRLQEGRQIEYKETLPGNDHEDKREFLADISSMANGAGGLILYGISEQRDPGGKTTGIPLGPLVGLTGINADLQTRRLENLLRDGVRPRMQGIAIRALELQNGNHILLIRVPRSWISPHVVDYSGHWRFYIRNSSGKHPMDLDEVRVAITSAEAVPDRIAQFRLDRLGKIATGETPVPLREGGKIVLHLLPLSMGVRESYINPSQVPPSRVRPMGAGSWGSRINMDGLVAFPGVAEAQRTYSQLFRSAAIEAVDTGLLAWVSQDKKIPGAALESRVVQATRDYLRLMVSLGVTSPVSIGISMLGVRGYQLVVSNRFRLDELAVLDRDDLIIPDTLIEDLTSDVPAILRPSLDMIWNAFGWPGSPLYDDSGNWTGDSRQ